MIGFHEQEEMERIVQAGQEVVIPKGTIIQSTHPQYREKIAGKSTTVKVHHLSPGQTVPEEYFSDEYQRLYPNAPEGTDKWGRKVYHTSNPQVVWAGSGGYWHRADIKDIYVAG